MAKDDIVKFYGVKETIAQMRKVEPEMLKDLRRNIRQIAQPAVSAIKSNTPKVAPLSGMVHNGRSAWSVPKVTIQVTPGARSGFGRTTANLVAIKAEGSGKVYGFEIADMAGRANQDGKYQQTRSFVDPRTGQFVKRRINGQGTNMIRVLNARYGPASRFVYKNLEDKLPAIRREVAAVVQKTMDDFSRRLNK
jgi:septum formation topological specificity factor MinE